jgi:asparagine synthase (glutamine-hydrolysing)
MMNRNQLAPRWAERLAGKERATSIIESMVRAIRHRGPDDAGLAWVEGKGSEVALGHARLSIVDLSAAGHQPMHDPRTGNWLVFNGEIYNYRELREQLDDGRMPWASQTDTEVILKAYARWGIDCIDHLRGMFAFALWDAAQEELFLVRDRLGIKPLYFYAGPGYTLFASEVRAILASELVPRKIDPIALDQYLTYQSVPSSRTMISEVQTMPPGSWMSIRASGRVREHRYWDLLKNAATGPAIGGNREDVVRNIGQLLRKSVELHLVSDVPVGVFLSGGIDSSAIVAMIDELGVRAQSFSVVFAEGEYNEAAFARQVARTYRTEHTELRLTEDGMLGDLPIALASMDQPSGDGINTYVVSKAVREAGVKVALSGLGGDEFFIGYPSLMRLERAMKLARRLAYLPATARHAAARAVEFVGGRSIQATKAAAMIDSDGSLAAMYPILRQVLSSAQRRSLYSPAWRTENGLEARALPDPYLEMLQSAYRDSPNAEMFARISYAEGRTYMHDVLLRDTDQMSMAHALEVRVPLLDHKLIESVMGVPDLFKRPNGTPKPLLVAAVGDSLPAEIVYRQKQGFTLPFADWMRGRLREFCESRLDAKRIADRGIFDAAQVHRLWMTFVQDSATVSWSRLWVLIALQEWIERNSMTF